MMLSGYAMRSTLARMSGEAKVRREPKLSPLACPQCGAAVPLGDGTVARCTYCSIDVPIPPQYIALRDDAKTRVSDRAELDRCYAEASRPPSAFVRGFAAIGDGLALVGLGGGALIIVGTIIAVLIREQDVMTAAVSALLMVVLAIPAFIETMFHLACARSYDLIDCFGPFAGVLPALAVWLFIAVPLLISKTCEGALASIIGLRMRLAAGRPVQPGGPATCRGCGAALDVPPGALGVRCTYCQTDNVVAIPAVVAAKDHRDTTHMHESIEKVLAKHAEQIATQRARLRRNLLVSLVGLLCAFGVLYFPAHYFLDGTFTIARTPSAHRGQLYPSRLEADTVIPQDMTKPIDLTFTWDCHGSTRKCIDFYVALKRGERVMFEASNHDLQFVLQRHARLVLSVGEYDPWVSDASLAARAPYTGWYRVRVSAPPGTDTVTTTLHWTTMPR
jgi:LSD1 subclass zinc finger protein